MTLADLLLILGAVCVVAGVFLLAVWLGFILLGVCCFGGALVLNDGEGLSWRERS